MTATTVRDMVLRQATSERPGLRFEELSWSWQEYVELVGRLCHALEDLLDPSRPPHVAALLDNVPQMAALLGGSGSAVTRWWA